MCVHVWVCVYVCVYHKMRSGALHAALDGHPAMAVIQAQPASTSLGQLLLTPFGSYSLLLHLLCLFHPWSRISATRGPDRCQGPLTWSRSYHIHQEDQRSDLSLFLSDLRLQKGCQRCHGCMVMWWRHPRVAGKTLAATAVHLHIHTGATHTNSQILFFSLWKLSAVAWTFLMGLSGLISLWNRSISPADLSGLSI